MQLEDRINQRTLDALIEHEDKTNRVMEDNSKVKSEIKELKDVLHD